MLSLENDIEEHNSKSPNDSAILDINSTPSTLGNNFSDEIGSNGSTSVEGSVVASPSIESFSTFPDLEVSESDTRDLQVKVDNPQKHVETLETYITFRITTKSSRPEFTENEYVVRRRYNDFIWLRQKLVEWYPTHITPPLPGKHSLLAQLDRYSKEFIIARMKLLHIFLNRIVDHPILSCDKHVCIFLTAKPMEFVMYRKNNLSNNGKVSDIFQLSNNPANLQRYQEFDHTKDYCALLSEKLTMMDKISKRIQKERQDYVSELNQLHPIFLQMSHSEAELCQMLEAMAKCVETSATAHKNLLEPSFIDEKDYISYIEAVKESLVRRDAIQNEFDVASEELNKRTFERDQLTGGSHEVSGRWESAFWKTETNSEKLERLSQSIPRITKLVEVLQDRLQCANENLRSDLDRWNAEKKVDLKNMLMTMADQQIAHYQQCTSAWEETLSQIKSNNPNKLEPLLALKKAAL